MARGHTVLRAKPAEVYSDKDSETAVDDLSGKFVSADWSLNEEQSLQVAEYLLALRNDPLFLLSGSGRMLAESPAGAVIRAATPAAGRALAALAVSETKTEEIYPNLSIKVGIKATPAADHRSNGRDYALIKLENIPATDMKKLTKRQQELISLLRMGMSNVEIGVKMKISPATVKTMLERLYRGSGVPNRQSLVHWAQWAGRAI